MESREEPQQDKHKGWSCLSAHHECIQGE